MSFRPLKIALLQAPLGRQEPPVYPLGLAVLGGTLKGKHSVSLFDPNMSGTRETTRSMKAFAPDVIGVSIRNIDSQMKRDLFYYYAWLKPYLVFLADTFPETTIVVGGSGFSLFPRRIMEENPGVHLGVYLEADEIFPELMDRIDSPENVKGVFFRKDGHVTFSGTRPLPDATSFVSPDFSLLPPKPYEKNGGIGIQTKRGCPLKCAYCTYPHLNGARFRTKPLESVMQEIRCLVEKHDVREITFVDGIFNLPKPRTIRLLEQLKRERWPLTWRGWFTELGFDKNFARLCRDTGCREFSFSPDGYGDRVLAALGKSIRTKDIQRIFHLAREIEGVRVAFNFFWNPPEQSLGSFLAMLWFAIRCKIILRDKAGGIIFGNPRIEPDTGIFERAIRDGVITPQSNLLPEKVEDLHKTFYSNPSTRYLDALYGLYSYAWRLKSGLFHPEKKTRRNTVHDTVK